MWIAKIIDDNPAYAQMQLQAPSEIELTSVILSYIKKAPHTTLTSQENPETLSPYFETELNWPLEVPEGEEAQAIEVTRYYYPVGYSIVIEDKTAEIEEANRLASLIESGIQDREKCQRVLDCIAGHNRARTLTLEQITAMQQTFASIEFALRSGRPDLARLGIEALVPDEVIVTQAMKTDALYLLNNN